MNNWSLAGVWNDSLDTVEQREYQPRDYVWASELGGSYYDRYWKMKGRQPTTPPNTRARRKFEAGNLIEWVILQVLNRAGALRSTQEHFIENSGKLKVTGRLDFEAGGEIKVADFSDFPETIKGIAEATLLKLQEKYPDGLANVNLEIKSCAGMMFDRYLLAPAPQHGLQAFVQAKATNRPTLLVYVSRDDLRICEWKILSKSEKYEVLYQKDLEQMAEILEDYGDIEDIEDEEIISAKTLFMEPKLVWNAGKFSSNWKITYSNYLTDYGYEQPDEYDKPAKSFATRLSNVAKKIREEKPLTKVNYQTLREGIEFFPEAKDIFIGLGVDKELLEDKVKENISE